MRSGWSIRYGMELQELLEIQGPAETLVVMFFQPGV